MKCGPPQLQCRCQHLQREGRTALHYSACKVSLPVYLQESLPLVPGDPHGALLLHSLLDSGIRLFLRSLDFLLVLHQVPGYSPKVLRENHTRTILYRHAATHSPCIVSWSGASAPLDPNVPQGHFWWQNSGGGEALPAHRDWFTKRDQL